MPGHTPDNSDLFAGVPERLANLLVRYYDDNLSEQEAAELRDGLMHSAAARDLFVRWGLQIQTLAESLAPQYSETDDPIAFEQLAEMEANAQAELVNLDARPNAKHAAAIKPTHASSSIAMRDLRSASGYLLRHALRSRYTHGSAIAAVLLLALILFNPLTNNTPAPQGTANNSTHPKPAVATLTNTHNTHNAQWAQTQAEGASAPGSLKPLTPGSKLHPNQRLTLTAGFAEITTASGAVVILQAPANIELLNDNALRLHTGKLVGICETPSSKGFLVRATHMDVTDLGTRFGVDATQRDTTKVHVYEGEVEVAASNTRSDERPKRLAPGQSAIANSRTGLVVHDYDPSLRFVTDWQALTSAPQLGGAMRYLPAMPTALGFNQTEADDILVFKELTGYRIEADTGVSLSQPRAGQPFVEQTTLSAGTRVDSYLVHYDIPGSDAEHGERRVGSVRFDRPILGVIVQGQALATSHQSHGVEGVSYAGMRPSPNNPAQRCGLDGPLEPDKQDNFELSDDRRTLTVELHVSNSIDQVRVFVQAEGDSR